MGEDDGSRLDHRQRPAAFGASAHGRGWDDGSVARANRRHRLAGTARMGPSGSRHRTVGSQRQRERLSTARTHRFSPLRRRYGRSRRRHGRAEPELSPRNQRCAPGSIAPVLSGPCDDRMRDPFAECTRFPCLRSAQSPRSPSRWPIRPAGWSSGPPQRRAGTASPQPVRRATRTRRTAGSWSRMLKQASRCWWAATWGAGVLRFGLDVEPTTAGVRIRAGANPPVDGRAADPDGTIEPAAGHAVEAPLTFLTLAEGGPDEVGNETFRYLKRHVLPQPVTGTPLAAYCVWLTRPRQRADPQRGARLREASWLRRVLPRCVLGGGQLHGARHERLGAGAGHL